MKSGHIKIFIFVGLAAILGAYLWNQTPNTFHAMDDLDSAVLTIQGRLDDGHTNVELDIPQAVAAGPIKATLTGAYQVRGLIGFRVHIRVPSPESSEANENPGFINIDIREVFDGRIPWGYTIARSSADMNAPRQVANGAYRLQRAQTYHLTILTEMSSAWWKPTGTQDTWTRRPDLVR